MKSKRADRSSGADQQRLEDRARLEEALAPYIAADAPSATDAGPGRYRRAPALRLRRRAPARPGT